MKEKLYYVEDIECGVVITTGTKNCPGKMFVPEGPAVTYICKNIDNAMAISRVILEGNRMALLAGVDIIIDVNDVFCNDRRFSDDEKNCDVET